nr:transmembrane emp24 domain-containing protein eca [Helicoverpa armigera]
MDLFSEIILLLFAILFLLETASALYFDLPIGEKKCFINEIPDDTTVTVNMKVIIYDPKSGGYIETVFGNSMHIEVQNPNGEFLISRIYQSPAKISFTSFFPGDHTFCMTSEMKPGFSGFVHRVYMLIQVGEHAINYANEEPQLQLRIGHLLNQVEQIKKEPSYQRYRIELFKEASGDITQRIIWCSVLTTFVCIIIANSQIRHIRSLKWIHYFLVRYDSRYAQVSIERR